MAKILAVRLSRFKSTFRQGFAISFCLASGLRSNVCWPVVIVYDVTRGEGEFTPADSFTLRGIDMRKWIWSAVLALPLAVVGGLVYAKSQQATADGYVCPVTGEELPCPRCCPLKQRN